MNYRERLLHQMSNVGKAYRRYPLTMLLLILLTLTNTWNIIDEFSGYEAIVHGLLLGIALTLVASHLNERFIQDRTKQLALFILSILLSIGYYFLLPPNDAYYFIAEVRTGVLVFTLLITFIWIPSIKNAQESFYQYFLAAFKYAFTTILYALILTIGVQAILSTIDYLFFNIDYDYFLHTSNIIWFIFATSYFLSLLPETNRYVETDRIAVKHDETIENNAFEITKFLKILISYIVIPLIAIYTIILLVYIALNITGEFWTDNLLEPMLISYTIILILVYLLASNIEDPITNFFRKVFPKILIFIVIFQTMASLLKIREMGISYGRYYVILFGIFSLIAGLIFSFLPKERSGLIVPVLIALSLVSLTPPIDAFTVAEKSQKNLLTETLTENGMLEENTVSKAKEISQKDKEKITSAVEYLEMHDYIEELAYLPKDFETYDDFEQVFGFPMTYDESQVNDDNFYQYASLDRSDGQVMDISEEDYFVELFIENYEEASPIETIQINPDYIVQINNKNRYPIIVIEDEIGDSILEIDLENLFEKAFAANPRADGMLNQEQMTLIVENEELVARVLAYELMQNESEEDEIISAQVYLFIQLKD